MTLNNIWSKYIQGADTLYYSRKLRFSQTHRQQFMSAFDFGGGRLNILEIGCGPGSLAGALRDWYPEADVTAIDSDSRFIEYAKSKEAGVRFLEADIADLPFESGSFDAVISNTVSEHVSPNIFYPEQLRVLKPGGALIVISTRKNISVTAECLKLTETEEQFWKRVSLYGNILEQYSVYKYPQNEAELPREMEKRGLKYVTTTYLTVSLTPDDPKTTVGTAHDIINADRCCAVDGVCNVRNSYPDKVSQAEAEEIIRCINSRFDERLRLYDAGEKQWDMTATVIMVVRGIKL